MLVDSLGDVVITNDGATILEELDVEHPAAKLVIQVAKSQDKEVGDGTTTAVVIAGELLKRGDELLEKKVHGTRIVSGYKLAAKKAQEYLDDIAIEVTKDNKDLLNKIAHTALNSKAVHTAKDTIAELAVNAVLAIAEEKGGKTKADLGDIKIIQRTGLKLSDSHLVEGVIIDKDVLHSNMPKSIEGAKIALINANIEVEKTEFDAEIRISDPNSIQSFLDQEEATIKAMVDKILEAGANVVICQKGVDDLAQHYLAKAGVLAVRRVKKSDMTRIARATGGKIVSSVKELSVEDLGEAGSVYEKKLGDDTYIYVAEAPNPRSVTVILRGSSKYATDEAERAFTDAISVVRNAIEDQKMLPGGGFPEIYLNGKLNEFADTQTGKERLAIQAFAESLLVIPTTLAENAGLDPLDIVAELKAAHSEGTPNIGLDLSQHNVGVLGKPGDMLKIGVLEPIRVKRQALKSASEAAELILRIDDVIAVKGGGPDAGNMGGMPPGGMPPGMGGMGGMPGMM